LNVISGSLRLFPIEKCLIRARGLLRQNRSLRRLRRSQWIGKNFDRTDADLHGTAGFPIVWGPARHTAGHNLASYHFEPSRFLVEFYADMDVYIPELNTFEPRPWHDVLPPRPKVWPTDQLTTWGTKYDFDFRAI
jgi:hypothetical protein